MEHRNDSYEFELKNKLVVGNHESLLWFGNEEQQKLREFSQDISMYLLMDNQDIENLIEHILKKIEQFQNSTDKKKIFSFSKNTKRVMLIKKYNNILVYIDKIEVALKLQEVQLIKNLKKFETMKKKLHEITKGLENVIRYGKNVVLQQKNGTSSEETENWYKRLNKKIENLEISYIIAEQSLTQINLMMENDVNLVSKILNAVTGTIPIWRNQITILLGIERMDHNIEIQNEVNKIVSKNTQMNKIRIDTDTIYTANDRLKRILDELMIMENRDFSIKLKLNDSLDNIL